MYKVIKYFTDLHDADHEYHPGDPEYNLPVVVEALQALNVMAVN